MEYIIQGIGILGFLIGILAFNFKEDIKMKFSMGVSSIFLTIHYFFMDAIILASLKFINTLRNFVTIKYSSTIILSIFIAVYWIAGFLYVEENIEWLPIITITTSTIAMFKLKGIYLKIGFIPANVVWIIMAIHTGSIGGFLLEFFILLVNFKTIYLMQRDKKLELA